MARLLRPAHGPAWRYVAGTAVIAITMAVGGCGSAAPETAPRTPAGESSSASVPSTRQSSAAPTPEAGATASAPVESTAPPSGSSTTAAPQPSGSSTAQNAPEEGPRSPAPQPTTSARIDSPVGFDNGVEVSITVEAVEVTAETPGEVSGPAAKVLVTVTNRSDQPVDLQSAVVSLSGTDGTLGVPTAAGDFRPFDTAIAPGASGTGSYIFMIDRPADRQVSVLVNYAAGAPFATFTGTIS